MIFNIHKSAKTEIDKMIENSNSRYRGFRVYIRIISTWLGPVFDVVLDEPSDIDKVFDVDGYKVMIHKELAEKINSIEIFFKEVQSENAFAPILFTDSGIVIDVSFILSLKAFLAIDLTLLGIV